MSDDHKAALAAGRNEGRAVRRYLEALEAHKPKRGRKRTPESIEKRLPRIEDKLPDADPLNRVKLIQERMDLTDELAAHAGRRSTSTELEEEFVKAAAGLQRAQGHQLRRLAGGRRPGQPC